MSPAGFINRANNSECGIALFTCWKSALQIRVQRLVPFVRLRIFNRRPHAVHSGVGESDVETFRIFRLLPATARCIPSALKMSAVQPSISLRVSASVTVSFSLSAVYSSATIFAPSFDQQQSCRFADSRSGTRDERDSSSELHIYLRLPTVIGVSFFHCAARLSDVPMFFPSRRQTRSRFIGRYQIIMAKIFAMFSNQIGNG